jgi:hypothetical protein
VAAISRAWVVIADTAVDPDSPLDAVLMAAIQGNLTHLREWLGNAFTAGAVQNHSHDGVDSALVAVGPNLIRNASFEQDTSGWTITTYSGGSSAVETANDAHGAKSLSFTSTVLANGGGDARSNEFIPCGGAVDLHFEVWRKGSVINIASKAEVIWYDDAQAPISVASIYTDTNTPTTATRAQAVLASPSTARFLKIKLTGGTPGAGSATGTIYFDGVNASDWTFIHNAAVGQAQLKTTTASGSLALASTASGSFALTGGTYSWWTASGSLANQLGFDFGNDNVAAGVIGVVNNNGTTRTFYVDERYVQASPPYNLGDGDIPLFVLALVAADGSLRGISVAPDPAWAYHGPTNIVPERIENGKAYRRYREIEGMLLDEVLKNPTVLARFVREQSEIVLVEREITQALKNRDMGLFPHPWVGNDLTGLTVVMLDPVGRLVDRLALISGDQGAREVRKLIEAGFLTIGNTPLARAAPPGVIPIAASWKLT